MATKYVSVARGSDTTGDGSAANPWKTIGHAIGGTPAFALDTAAANTLYVEPGVYRETITLGVAPTSAGPLAIRGDFDGAGFLAGGHASPTTGLVDWRAWSDDLTEMSASNITASGKNYVSVSRVKFTGANVGSGAISSAAGGASWTFEDCEFVSGFAASCGNCMTFTASAGVPLNLTVQRCKFHTYYYDNGAILIFLPMNATDWSLGVNIVNCLFQGKNPALMIYMQNGSGAFLAGGVSFQNCTVEGSYNHAVLAYLGTTTVPSSPVAVHGCIFVDGDLNALASGQIVEDGNVFSSRAANTLVAAGANSKFGVCPALDFGDDVASGLHSHAVGMPAPTSVYTAFGNYGTTPTDDIYGNARPATASAGCVEYATFSTGGGGGGGGGTVGVLNLGASMGYSDDFGVGQKPTFPFWTSASLTGGAASVLRDDGVESTEGVTIEVDRASTTGRNAVVVDTAADSAFYIDNHDYEVSLTAGTAGAASAVGLIGSFSIRNRPAPVKGVAFHTAGIKSVGG